MRYLVDSDAVIDHLKGVESSIQFLQRLVAGGNELCTCAATVSEVFAGLAPERQEPAITLLGSYRYLETSFESARNAGEWRYLFRRQGVALSTPDVLIAATALANDAALVTGNVSDFPMAEIGVVPLPRVRR